MTMTNSDEERPRTAWVVRAGKRGEDEDAVLRDGIAIIGFHKIGNLSNRNTREKIAAQVNQDEPDRSPKARGNHTGQLHALINLIRSDDIVVLPLKTRPGQLAVGTVSGQYEYRELNGVGRHTRPVQWLRDDVARIDLALDLRKSVNRPPTVYEITTENAAQRLVAIADGHSESAGLITAQPDAAIAHDAEESGVDDLNPIAEIARDEIHDHIRERFRGHEFARLVDAIIRAQGYTTPLSPLGPDGGIDILAGRGALGFGSPRLCVQVKATSSAADVKVVRELQGAMQKFGADQCLFVSLGGFTRPARLEARQCYFNTRLWDANDVIQAIYAAYDNLAEEIQAEIPLKQVWTLVRDDG